MTNWRTGLNAELVKKIEEVLLAMEKIGHPMRVCQGFRTVEEQAALYAQGRTAPGKKVTNADGIKVKSNHQSGRAVDCCFLTEPFGEHQPWDRYGKFGKALELEWGGDWKSPIDRPHLEMLS